MACPTLKVIRNQKKKGGKRPKILTEITEQEQLVGAWRNWNPKLKNFTYYSASKKPFFRIDMILIPKKLEVQTSKIGILPKVISDHNPVLWTLRSKQRGSLGE